MEWYLFFTLLCLAAAIEEEFLIQSSKRQLTKYQLVREEAGRAFINDWVPIPVDSQLPEFYSQIKHQCTIQNHLVTLFTEQDGFIELGAVMISNIQYSKIVYIIINPGITVTTHTELNFTGNSITLNSSSYVANLQIRSLKVNCLGFPMIILYSGYDFVGVQVKVGSGKHIPRLMTHMEWEDDRGRYKSMKVLAYTKVTIYSDDHKEKCGSVSNPTNSSVSFKNFWVKIPIFKYGNLCSKSELQSVFVESCFKVGC